VVVAGRAEVGSVQAHLERPRRGDAR
jgi:hypothetical protein